MSGAWGEPSPWPHRLFGVGIGLLVPVLGVVALVVVSSLWFQGGASQDAGWLLMIAALNPGVSAVVLGPVAAVLLRRRKQALIALLVTLGLVVLLNAGCWGVIAASGSL